MKILDTAPLLVPAVCLMAGIVLGRELQLSTAWLWLLVADVVVACLLWKWRRLQTITIMVGVVLFGALLMNVNSHTSDDSDSVMGRSRGFFLSQREVLLERFAEAGLADDNYAIVAAMVLGDKSALSRDIKNTYSITGASHVLALSGLHLGIIYVLLSMLVVGRRWRFITQILIILSIWAFVFLVGMPTSGTCGSHADGLCTVGIGASQQDVCQHAGLHRHRHVAVPALGTLHRQLPDVVHGRPVHTLVRAVVRTCLLGRIPDDTSLCEMAMGYSDRIVCCPDRRGAAHCLLLRTLLLLVPADQLHRHPCGHVDSLPLAVGIAHTTAGFPASTSGEWSQQRADADGTTAGSQY